MALKLGIQTYQILTNDNEVCVPSLSNILLAVRIFSKYIWYFLRKLYSITKIFLTYCEKKLFYWSRKTRLKVENLQIFWDHWNNVFNAFLTCSWRFLISNKLKQLHIIQIGKKIWEFRNLQEKLENTVVLWILCVF